MGKPEATSLACPRCRSNGTEEWMLLRPKTREIRAHGCPGCGGSFLSVEAVRRLSERFPEGLDNTSEFRTTVADRKAAPAMTCPVCNHGMRRVRSPVVDVDIDVCDLHGTFYDPGEIGLIARALRASGMYGGSPFDELTAPPRAAVSGVARHATRPIPSPSIRTKTADPGRVDLAEIAPPVAASLAAGTAIDHGHDALTNARDSALDSVLSALGLLAD